MCNENKKIVQEGLERRATTRRKRMNDAAHDAAERKLRIEINRCTRENRAAIEAEQERAAAARAHLQQEAAYKRAQIQKEAHDSAMWNDLAVRVYCGLIAAAGICFCFTHEAMAGWVAIPGILAASAYSIAALVNFARNR